VELEINTKINKVKRLRFELNLKQWQLAEMLGCDQSLIAKIETGAAPLSDSKAAKLAEITKEHLNIGKE
jgi:predicted transcriptional regulator